MSANFLELQIFFCISQRISRILEDLRPQARAAAVRTSLTGRRQRAIFTVTSCFRETDTNYPSHRVILKAVNPSGTVLDGLNVHLHLQRLENTVFFLDTAE